MIFVNTADRENELPWRLSARVKLYRSTAVVIGQLGQMRNAVVQMKGYLLHHLTTGLLSFAETELLK